MNITPAARMILTILGLVCLTVLGSAPLSMAEDEWTTGTVQEIQKPQGYQPMGTSPSGVLQGRLTYGYYWTGPTQSAFVDLRLQDGDTSYGLAGGFPLPSGGVSVQPVRWAAHYSTPSLTASFGSDGWSAAVTRSISSDLSVRFAAGPSWQSAQVYAARDGWSVVGSYVWSNGVPSAHISATFSQVWTWAK